METKLLEDLGLTKGEIKVYLYLLTRPQTKATKIAQETKLNRSNLYAILDSLINKNLVASTIINKVCYYSANKPDYLKNLVEQKIDFFNKKKKELNKVIPKIGKLNQQFGSEIKIEFYQGKEGIKQVLEKILRLKRGEVVYSFGHGKLFEKEFKYYFRKFKKERSKKGIQFKGIFKKTKKIKKQKNISTPIRYIDLKGSSKVEVVLFKKALAIFSFSSNPSAVFIKSGEIYDHLLNYFNFIADYVE